MFCKKCGKEFEGKFCPECGEPAETVASPERAGTILNGVPLTSTIEEIPKKEPFYSQTWFIILMMFCCCFPIGLFLMWKYKKFNKPVRIIISIFAAYCFISGIRSAVSSTASESIPEPLPIETSFETSAAKAKESAEAAVTAVTADTTVAETRTEETTTASEAENIPTEFKSALNKAKTYSDIMSMSKQGIYNQLTSEYGEKFSAEAAQYAIDNMEADWKANALEKAKTYQNTMSMSPAAIRDQLTSEYGEKFTQEEADYAVANLE